MNQAVTLIRSTGPPEEKLDDLASAAHQGHAPRLGKNQGIDNLLVMNCTISAVESICRFFMHTMLKAYGRNKSCLEIRTWVPGSLAQTGSDWESTSNSPTIFTAAQLDHCRAEV